MSMGPAHEHDMLMGRAHEHDMPMGRAHEHAMLMGRAHEATLTARINAEFHLILICLPSVILPKFQWDSIRSQTGRGHVIWYHGILH